MFQLFTENGLTDFDKIDAWTLVSPRYCSGGFDVFLKPEIRMQSKLSRANEALKKEKKKKKKEEEKLNNYKSKWTGINLAWHIISTEHLYTLVQ